MMKNYCYCLFLIVVITACKTNSIPDPTRFATEIKQFAKIAPVAAKEVVVFTGSSSVRMWKDVQDYYPQYLVINTGFGGSQMSDLWHYLDETVLQFQPTKVFLYEGDNDINDGQSIKDIMRYTRKVVKTIEKKLPNTEIVLISAKPSPARWQLRAQYEQLNQAFAEYAEQKSNRYFADVWTVMLDDNGEVRKDIFIADRLHMNRQGYELWDGVIQAFVER